LCEEIGFNVPYITWQLATGQKPDRVGSLRSGVRWVHGSRDAVAALAEITRGRLSLLDYLRSLIGPHAFASFAADDPMPGLLELPVVAYRVVSGRLPMAVRTMGRALSERVRHAVVVTVGGRLGGL
jgi:predicted ATP-grasp superfamily ATP-dependent carboligase